MSSDDDSTDDDPGASVFRSDVAWPDDAENDKRRKTAAVNWPQLLETIKAEKFNDDCAAALWELNSGLR